jgi:NADH dehydrogenase
VLILGGGFAGVTLAKRLTRRLARRKDVHVELLNEENYFVFQPLLPEVAAGGIHANHVVNPIRELVPRARFRLCTVREVDTRNKIVRVEQGEGLHLVDIPYDHLVFCLGKVADYSRIPGAEHHALSMRTMADAFYMRNHIIRCLELADIETDPNRRKMWLTFVVAGGGFSGVETVGELHELVERTLKYFKTIDKSEIRFVLVHSRNHLLPEMPRSLGEAAGRMLTRRGIELRLGVRVRAASRDFVYFNDGDRRRTRTFVCTVGNSPNPIAAQLLAQDNFVDTLFRDRPIGLFKTDAHLRCEGQTHYWALGDCAGIPDLLTGELCPPTAQFAVREAKVAADNILASIDDKPLREFKFKPLGMMASLGRSGGVGLVLGVKLTGFMAWFVWRTIYLLKLPGFVRKARVALDWSLGLVFPRDLTQLQESPDQGPKSLHFEPGETIIEKGEVARELFMVVSGTVEVFSVNEEGQEQSITTLGPKEVFGERALLQDCERGATIRCQNAVEVICLPRKAFRTLIGQFPVLENHFETLMRARFPELFTDKSLQETLDSESSPITC